jgi:hypothetical protein
MDWQHPYDEKRAAAWLERISEVRAVRSIKQRIGRQIVILKNNPAGGILFDGCALIGWQLGATGEFPFITYEKIQGERDEWREVWRDATGSLVAVPPFTTDVSAALTIWPEDRRPAQWTRTAVDCCIEALAELRRRVADA